MSYLVLSTYIPSNFILNIGYHVEKIVEAPADIIFIRAILPSI